MISALDQRINDISKAWHDAREAELYGHSMLPSLTNGLVKSCLLLQDIQNDDIVASIDVGARISDAQGVLADARKMTEFLKVERGLLEVTKLDATIIDELISLTRLDIPLSQVPTRDEWNAKLSSLTSQVCAEAKMTTGQLRNRSLLKQTVVAGGGALLAILNLLPPFPLPSGVVQVSTGAGVWLIYTAASNYFKEFFDR